MSALLKITVALHSDVALTTAANRYIQPTNMVDSELRCLAELFERAQLGLEPIRMTVGQESGSSTPATGSVTVASHADVSDGDTVTIGTQALTVAAAPANQNEWAAGADETADAVSLAACINAHTELSALVSASADTGVVTLTARSPGLWGKHLRLATSDGTAFTIVAMALSGTPVANVAERTYAKGL